MPPITKKTGATVILSPLWLLE